MELRRQWAVKNAEDVGVAKKTEEPTLVDSIDVFYPIGSLRLLQTAHRVLFKKQHPRLRWFLDGLPSEKNVFAVLAVGQQ